jgi:putative nucleotidyltransferase with HDIG domain
MGLAISNTTTADAFLRKHRSLQALPENAGQIMRLASDPNSTSPQLIHLIEKDAALAAAIMKAVNSAYYSLPTKMTRLDRAVTYLGMNTVKEIVASACLSKLCKAANFGKYTATDLWNHGVCAAIIARELAARTRKFDPEAAFLAGLLQDIGLMLEAQADPAKGMELLVQAELGAGSFTDLEQGIFGFTHCELGAALARKWQFPESQLTVIHYHHTPELACDELKDLCHHFYVADTLASGFAIGCPLPAMGQQVDARSLDPAGITQPIIDEVVSKVPLLMRLHQV